MKNRKICVVITARPSYSRIKTALYAIREHSQLELQLVVAASALLDRYGNTVKQIERDGFEIAAKVYMALEGSNPVTSTKTTGVGMMDLATVFDNLKPDAVVTIADRFETIATALAATNMNIPLVHIQGGEVTGSIDEKIRHAVTKLADIHLVSTEKARERVIKMGEDPEKVIVTGCPSIDIAASIMKEPFLNFDPIQRYGGVGKSINFLEPYIVVMQHPVTTEHELARQHTNETLKAIAGLNMQTIWLWPNMDAGSDATAKSIRAFRERFDPEHMWFVKSMGPEDFLRVLYNSKGIVGNSSVAIRECSYLGVPAVNIGTRQNGRERGKNVIDVGYHHEEIEAAILSHLKNGHVVKEHLYGDGKAGEKVAYCLATASLTTQKILSY